MSPLNLKQIYNIEISILAILRELIDFVSCACPFRNFDKRSNMKLWYIGHNTA